MSGWTEDDLVRWANSHRPGTLDPKCEAPAEDTLEAPIQAEVTKLLEEDDWRSLRTDPVSDRGRGRGFGEIGMADYLYIRYWPDHESLRRNNHQPGTLATLCCVMWIEFKRSKGGGVSKAQRDWHIKERARGALTLIAGEDFTASVEGFKVWYRASGLQRRGISGAGESRRSA